MQGTFQAPFFSKGESSTCLRSVAIGIGIGFSKNFDCDCDPDSDFDGWPYRVMAVAEPDPKNVSRRKKLLAVFIDINSTFYKQQSQKTLKKL